MIKGAVIFGANRFAAISQAMSQVVTLNPSMPDYKINETPRTMNFVAGDKPNDWRTSMPLPDRWFIHWDQF